MPALIFNNNWNRRKIEVSHFLRLLWASPCAISGKTYFLVSRINERGADSPAHMPIREGFLGSGLAMTHQVRIEKVVQWRAPYDWNFPVRSII